MVTNQGGRASAVPADWRKQFAGAYDEEFRVWIGDITAGRAPSGPSWSDAGRPSRRRPVHHRAGHGGGWTPVLLRERPDFYRQ